MSTKRITIEYPEAMRAEDVCRELSFVLSNKLYGEPVAMHGYSASVIVHRAIDHTGTKFTIRRAAGL